VRGESKFRPFKIRRQSLGAARVRAAPAEISKASSLKKAESPGFIATAILEAKN
jgi:hypothetical protein